MGWATLLILVLRMLYGPIWLLDVIGVNGPMLVLTNIFNT